MKFKSLVFAQASGSVGGLTYSHNLGGMYIRNRSIPVNPNTPAQQGVRAALKTLTTRWNDTLSSLQRQQWANYAAAVSVLNKLGEPIFIPPLAMYVRCNSARLQFVGASAIVDDGPTIMSLATMTPPTVTFTAPVAHFAFTNTDAWANEAGGYMFVYMSRPQSPGVIFFKGPFQWAANIVGATPTPPTSPQNVTSPFGNFSAGQKIFFRARVSRADGRISSDVIIGGVA